MLDFGVGWGRLIRFFLKDVAPRNLVGLDCYEPAITACRETNRWCRFERCDPFPPTDLEEEFDLIYAFSVFSHLSEPVHRAWLEELGRLLDPSGVLILTTFQRAFLEKDAPGQVAAYDCGKFCFRELACQYDGYGNAFIPEAYARKNWPLQVQEFLEVLRWGQNIIVATKG